jgi:serine protease Do
VIDLVAGTEGLAEELAKLALRVQASVVGIRTDGAGFGSGVIWNDRGIVVTNHHVTPRRKARVDFGEGVWRGATVVARSERDDLAALEVDGELPDTFLAASIGDARALRPGELVLAVGNPVGERKAVTLGMVSRGPAAGGFPYEREVIHAAITLRPGNSGGALADARGRVVGIPNLVIGPGLGVAVPSHVVDRMLQPSGQQRVISLGLVGRWVELPVQGKATRLALLVLEVAGGGRGERAGVLLGDVLVAERGGRAGAVELIARIEALTAGQAGVLHVLRAGVVHEVQVVAAAA